MLYCSPYIIFLYSFAEKPLDKSRLVNTRNPIEHDEEYEMQALVAIEQLQGLGVKVLYTIRHHRKLAIIDGTVTWNGSLNILSQHDSCEIMWRVASKGIADQLLGFIKLTKYTGR